MPYTYRYLKARISWKRTKRGRYCLRFVIGPWNSAQPSSILNPPTCPLAGEVNVYHLELSRSDLHHPRRCDDYSPNLTVHLRMARLKGTLDLSCLMDRSTSVWVFLSFNVWQILDLLFKYSVIEHNIRNEEVDPKRGRESHIYLE